MTGELAVWLEAVTTDAHDAAPDGVTVWIVLQLMLIMLGFLGCMSPSGAEIVTADAQDIARVGVPAGDCLLPKPSQLMLMMLRLRRCPSVLVWNLSQLMLTMLALSGCLPVSPEIVVAPAFQSAFRCLVWKLSR